RAEAMLVPGIASPGRDAHPAGTRRHETVALSGGRGGVGEDAGGAEPEHRLAQVTADEHARVRGDTRLERAVAVEDPDVQPAGCRREPEAVVERDRGTTPVSGGLRRRRQPGRRCQRDEREAHYALKLKVAFSPLTVTTTL